MNGTAWVRSDGHHHYPEYVTVARNIADFARTFASRVLRAGCLLCESGATVAVIYGDYVGFGGTGDELLAPGCSLFPINLI